MNLVRLWSLIGLQLLTIGGFPARSMPQQLLVMLATGHRRRTVTVSRGVNARLMDTQKTIAMAKTPTLYAKSPDIAREHHCQGAPLKTNRTKLNEALCFKQFRLLRPGCLPSVERLYWEFSEFSGLPGVSVRWTQEVLGCPKAYDDTTPGPQP